MSNSTVPQEPFVIFEPYISNIRIFVLLGIKTTAWNPTFVNGSTRVKRDNDGEVPRGPVIAACIETDSVVNEALV